MTPLRQWLVVKRRTAPSAHSLLILPDQNLAEALIGDVLSVGRGFELKNKVVRALDVKPGEVVSYSSRIDSYKTKEGDFDIIEEGSVIGIL